MADFPNKQLNQTAVYWASPTQDGYGGFTWSSPVEIDCRWQNSTKVITTGNGDEIVCKAIVYVNQDVDEEGMLYLGDLDDLDSGQEADPMTVDGAYKILRFDKSPTVRGDAYLRKVYL